MTDFTFWPDAHSEAFSDEQAEAIRETFAGSTPWLVKTPKPDGVNELPAPTFIHDDPNAMTLTVRKAWRAAPWAGFPFVYVWKVALSEDWSEWVSGPAERVWGEDYR